MRPDEGVVDVPVEHGARHTEVGSKPVTLQKRTQPENP
jgi:hypothetical protein